MKRVLIPLAQGTEEIEAITLMDVLTRAGAQVYTASVDHLKEIHCSRDAKILVEYLLDALKDESFDLIALPGGAQGAENLAKSETLRHMLKEQKAAGKLYGAICASPAIVFSKFGLIQDKAATCYPTFSDRLEAKEKSTKSTLVDGNCITSQGPATAMGFALTLVEALYSKEKRDEVAKGLLYPH